MSDDQDPALKPAARCGKGAIDGACWRPGDPVKHLGPPYHLQIHYWSRLFQTRCGLGPVDDDGTPRGWRRQGDWGGDGPFGPGTYWGDDDDYWCPACLQQAGIAYEMWPDDDEPLEGGKPA